jgi:hypothetical protein
MLYGYHTAFALQLSIGEVILISMSLFIEANALLDKEQATYKNKRYGKKELYFH